MKTNDKEATVEIPLGEQITAALAAGDYVLLTKLAKKAENEKKLAAIAAMEEAAKAAKAPETANVAKVKKELIDQLTNEEFVSFASLWTVIKTTVPQPTNVKAAPGKSNGTKADGRTTKTALTAEMTATGCSLEDLVARFAEVYPEDTNPEGHARMYLASYAKKNPADGLYYAK
jgi:hydroxyethylthiazole kinase-like sugar kinase family protein